jgi:hypothetical protein
MQACCVHPVGAFAGHHRATLTAHLPTPVEAMSQELAPFQGG